MIAFDTSWLVRVAVNDDPAQEAIVRRLMRTDTVFPSRTVLLETEWVLRSRYRQPPAIIVNFFEALLAAEGVVLEDSDLVGAALEWYRMGADFADALHLAFCGTARMYTFDQRFCKTARDKGLTPAIQILGTR